MAELGGTANLGESLTLEQFYRGIFWKSDSNRGEAPQRRKPQCAPWTAQEAVAALGAMRGHPLETYPMWGADFHAKGRARGPACCFVGAPWRIRTVDLGIRSPLLYPTELMEHKSCTSKRVQVRATKRL